MNKPKLDAFRLFQKGVDAQNRDIQKRQSERADKLVEERKVENRRLSRANMRAGISGQPKSRIFSEKMAIPKSKKRRIVRKRRREPTFSDTNTT